MAFSSQTGFCTSFNTSTNLATPFVRSSCFEPAYINAQPTTSFCGSRLNEEAYGYQLNSVPHYGRRGQCLFDRECSEGSTCQNGICIKASPFDSRNSIFRRENSRIVGYANEDYKSPDGRTCKTQPYWVVDETGQKKVVCPILTSHDSQPQCNTCMNSVFDCDRFKESDPQKYRQCLEYQRMIHYNLVTPNGQLINFAFEMDGQGFEVADAVLKRCNSVCGSCKNFDHTSCESVFNKGGCLPNGAPSFF